MLKDIEFVTTFTTGRTGTALLTQLFSGKKYEKDDFVVLNKQQNIIVTHECWNDLPIEMIKTLAYRSEEYNHICQAYLEKKVSEIKSKYPNFSKLVITDHRFGRFFAPFFINNNLNYKIIRLRRKPLDVVDSFVFKMKKKESSVDRKHYKYYQRRLWTNAFYSPFDKETRYPVDPINWGIMSDEEKVLWYVQEVKRVWKELVNKIPEEKYIEAGFENIIYGTVYKRNNVISCPEMNKISKFIEMPYSKHLLKHKVNQKEQ